MTLACSRSVTLEVIDHSRGVITKVAKIYCLTTLLQQEHSIEYLEQLGGRLMDADRK